MFLITQNGITIGLTAMLYGRSGITNEHMVTGSTLLLRFKIIWLLSHYMKDILLSLPELFCPNPNGGQVQSDVVMHTLFLIMTHLVRI